MHIAELSVEQWTFSSVTVPFSSALRHRSEHLICFGSCAIEGEFSKFCKRSAEVMGPNFTDEIDCGNFFDQIDDLIEFPPDDECGNGNLVSSGDCKSFPTWDEVLPDCDPLFSGSQDNGTSDLSSELFVPYEDIVQLEWLSTFVEDSFSGEGLTLRRENLRANASSLNQFQTSSPVTVLERGRGSSSSSSSSSSSGGKTLPRGPQRARSKRPRPTTFNPRPVIHLIPPSSSSSGSDNFADSHAPTRKPEQKKPRKIRITMLMDPNMTSQYPPRKCMHCEITKTPQWRAGPMGPKTLCNACGVRYKSGRLFPEYRPAASPTFVPALHSNSHKKVLEMRSKVEPENAATSEAAAKPELVPTASLS